MKILHITPDFNYACGRSYYVYLLLKYFSMKGHSMFIASNGGDSFDRLNGLNTTLFILKGLKSKNPLSITKNINSIRKIIIENKIEIIHTHHRYSELIALNAVKLIRKNKPASVMTALSIVDTKYAVEYKSDKIIAVSNSVKNMLINRFNVKKEKIVMIPNFTDTGEMHELDTLMPIAREPGKFYNILAIGRFHHEKNFEVLLKALNMLDNKENRLILIGEGDRYINYREYINSHNLNVEIIVPQKNLLQYFLSADVCVLPSVRDPFPNFMLQSGLHKKPFIGTNADGIAELIINGYNGLLFNPGDENELADKINIFKSDKRLANSCAQNLFSDVINNYTQDLIIPKIEKLYRKLIN